MYLPDSISGSRFAMCIQERPFVLTTSQLGINTEAEHTVYENRFFFVIFQKLNYFHRFNAGIDSVCH